MKFADLEKSFEASITNMSHWMDCFFIYSMIWAFGSILTDEAKIEFDIHIKTIFAEKAAREKT